MRRVLVIAGVWICAWGSVNLTAEEPTNVPNTVPATRPELKTALERLKDRQPRIPVPAPSGETGAGGYLPATWGGGGGLGGFGQVDTRGARDRRGRMLDARLDRLFIDASLWVVSRSNNCQYCLGHQELKLRAVGVDDDTIAALDTDWSRFDLPQQAVLAFARKLTLQPEAVGEADIARLKAHFTDAEIIELAFVVARFNAVNRWTEGLGLPQERHFRGDQETSFLTPTSAPFQSARSVVAPLGQGRLTSATLSDVERGIAANRNRTPRITLPAEEAAREELENVLGDREPYVWERALSHLPVNGRTHVLVWNTILTDDHLTLRLKAELCFITARHNRAWYAAAHALHRLEALGASPEDVALLCEDSNGSAGGPVAAYRLAAKITTAPHLLTDGDIQRVRESFSDAEAAQILQVVCLANLFDRFTESLGLPVEGAIAGATALLDH